MNANVKLVKSLTNNNVEKYTITENGYYFITAINTGNSGACAAYILDSSNTIYICATQAPNGQYVRASTSPIPLKKGAVINIRSTFTDNGGLYKIS